jgi:hypothetical protein
MKRFTLVIAAVLCIVVMFGCAKKQSDEVIKNIDFKNAPTLGPVYEKYIRAFIDQEWSKAWDCTSSGTHKRYEKMLEVAKNTNIDELKKEKTDTETNLAAAPDDATKKAIQAQIKEIDTQIADFDKIKGMDARAYFIYTMETAAKNSEDTRQKDIADFAKKKVEIVKEEINGDSGKIIEKIDGKQDEIPFVKESGEWKFGSKE